MADGVEERPETPREPPSLLRGHGLNHAELAKRVKLRTDLRAEATVETGLIRSVNQRRQIYICPIEEEQTAAAVAASELPMLHCLKRQCQHQMKQLELNLF